MCGTGFVVDVAGRSSHRVLQHAITALVNLAHRGARGADGVSGDGAGVLTQLPHRLLRRSVDLLDLSDDDIGVAMVFLPEDPHQRRQCVEALEGHVAARGMRPLSWRVVPHDRSVLGEKARQTCPNIQQLVIQRADSMPRPAFERALYLARRAAEQDPRGEGMYIASMSCRTLVYKGLVTPDQLSAFYADLADDEYETAIAVFHARFSTNTSPQWALAQPLRMLAHNGEINTLLGNRNWIRARSSWMGGDWDAGDRPLVQNPLQPKTSDSGSLDNVLELLCRSGRGVLHSMLMLVPPAHWTRETSDDVRNFFRYHEGLMRPWDGPAALTLSDGRRVAACLDRNGLRPLRFQRTSDGLLVVGSEAGIAGMDEDLIVERGRLGPGEILAVDTVSQTILRDADVKGMLAARQPYGAWLAAHAVSPPDRSAAEAQPIEAERLPSVQVAFGYGRETCNQILASMAKAKIPVGSMGDDTPLTVLSAQPQNLYRYFKQHFAQVTNPPIDPYREAVVMSLHSLVGPRGALLDEQPEAARMIRFASPLLDTRTFRWLCEEQDRAEVAHLDATFPVSEGAAGLEAAVARLCAAAASAVPDEGSVVLVLSDRDIGPQRAPVPMLLATAAVHHHLISAGLRLRVDLVCDTGEPRTEHHFACLIGYGATLVHPWLAYAGVLALADGDPGAVENYCAAAEKGLLKVLARVGISTLRSYRGAQAFEAVGLSRRFVERYFRGTPSRVDGVGLAALAEDVLELHERAWPSSAELPSYGRHRYRRGGEYHAFNPKIAVSLHRAVVKGDFEAFQAYARTVDERPPTALRDLLRWRKAAQPIPLEEVEPASAIVVRFSTQAMSHGALSREAHEVLAVAMNRLGARSNSGEGGEAPSRFRPYAADAPEESLAGWHPSAGDNGNSAVKQVASGRFGVTAAYIAAARELEIKMAQGSKPGEGGQLPGHKVTDEIARLRHSTPGVPLISPPPHHDIYSIEDLAQLIFDLKRVNPAAPVCVKLVSGRGIGTIAVGVAKAHADIIQVSGHDGGTGASPLSSIKHAGLPWELGLTDVHQVLAANGLRDRITLRVDGGLRTGRDVVLAALMGAEQFGFGTAALVAIGCRMVRKCHENSCPVGIATQRPELRARFPGQPEQVVALMMFIAEHVRMILAEMGARSLDEVIGDTGRLALREDVSHPLDLSALLRPAGRPRQGPPSEVPPRPPGLDEQVFSDAAAAQAAGRSLRRRYTVTNRDRSIGARLAGHISRLCGPAGLPDDSFRLTFIGSAGQSFGAFAVPGMHLRLWGEAQDYVGKGLCGGVLVVGPRHGADPSVLIGNTVLYGATSGRLHAVGRAGERLCVRNSGAIAVVEGCGDHGCEYMTGGAACILGSTGTNFAAGMSGGVAYVYDDEQTLRRRLNTGLVDAAPVQEPLDVAIVRQLLLHHLHATGSDLALTILSDFPAHLPAFLKVKPRLVTHFEEENRIFTLLQGGAPVPQRDSA